MRSDRLAALPNGAGIAIVRLRSLGDVILTTPALAALKQFRPDLRLAYLVEPNFAAALHANPAIDAIIPVPKEIAGRARAARQLRRFRPEMVLNLHGGSTAALLTRASGAPHRVTFLGLRHKWAHTGFSPPEAPEPPRRSLHTVEHIASMLRWLGLPRVDLGPLHLRPQEAALAGVRQRLRAAGLDGPFAFLSPSPRSFTMRWDPQRWVVLLRRLHRRTGWGVVMASPEADAAIEAWIARELASGQDPIPVALLKGTSVADLIALEAQARMVLGSDGGPLHVAAALQKPTLAIFSSTDSEAWAPWQTPHRLVRRPFPCAPCRSDRCYAFAEPRCILELDLETVQSALDSLLGDLPGD